METRSSFRPACSNPSRRTTLLLSSPMWRSRRRETESSRLPARNKRLSTNSSPAIWRPSAPHVRSCGTPRPDTSAAGSRSAHSCRWAKRASAISVSTNGSTAHRQKPDPASANRRIELHETDPLFAAGRHPAVRQRPRGCAEVEERQGDPGLPARAAQRSRQEHQGRARRIRPGRLLARTHACQIRVYLRDGGLAGIGADAVAVAGQLGEALSGLVGRRRSVVDLTADRPLEHDVLINSAGINGKPGQTTGNVDYISWAQVLDVNTMGPLRVTEALVDYIARSKRKLVVTITSGMGSLADNTWGGSIA